MEVLAHTIGRQRHRLIAWWLGANTPSWHPASSFRPDSPTYEKNTTLSFSPSDVMQSNSELVTTSQAVPQLAVKTHSCIYGMWPNQKPEKKEKCQKSWVNRGSFKLKDFKQTQVGRDCKEFESALLQLFMSKQYFLSTYKNGITKRTVTMYSICDHVSIFSCTEYSFF